jgi:predicted MFS family arabinose efflux permease
VIAANVLLGVNQGLTWSMTVNMKIDLIGPGRRGVALGINETTGYLGIAITALATGHLATGFGLRPAPEWPGAGHAAVSFRSRLHGCLKSSALRSPVHDVG